MENTKKRGDKRGKDEVRGGGERRNPGTERGRGGEGRVKDAVRRDITCEFESSCCGDAAPSTVHLLSQRQEFPG